MESGISGVRPCFLPQYTRSAPEDCRLVAERVNANRAGLEPEAFWSQGAKSLMQAGCIRATDRIWSRSAPKHEPVALIQEVTFDPGNEDRVESKESRSDARGSRNL